MGESCALPMTVVERVVCVLLAVVLLGCIDEVCVVETKIWAAF